MLKRQRSNFMKKNLLSKIKAIVSELKCLDKIIVIPFISEKIYQNIVCEINDGFPKSVHLSDFPEYDQNLDNTLGFFHIKDFIKNIENENFKLKDILRQVLYVAPKSPILELLKRMRSSSIHMG